MNALSPIVKLKNFCYIFYKNNLMYWKPNQFTDFTWIQKLRETKPESVYKDNAYYKIENIKEKKCNDEKKMTCYTFLIGLII